jgi:hypothetical protein
MWVQGSSYPYVIALMADTAAVADFAAARLPAAPLALLCAGWTRFFLPAASSTLAEGGAGVLWRKSRMAVGLPIGLMIAYLTALFAIHAIAGAAFWPAKYAHLGPLVGLWCLYFLFTAVRGVASTALLAQMAFRTVFSRTSISAVAAIAGMLVLGLLWNLPGILVGMLVGEAVLGVLGWREFARRSAVVSRTQAGVAPEAST